MKKILLVIAIFLVALISQGQDSLGTKVGPFQIQARDANLYFRAIRHQCENLFDSISADYRDGTRPTGTQNTGADLVEILELVALYKVIMADTYGNANPNGQRILTVIKGISNTFLQNLLNLIDADMNATRTLEANKGEEAYMKIRRMNQ